jgi:YD repeat-containing protein
MSAGASSFTYDSVGRLKGRVDGAGGVLFGYSYTVSPVGGQVSTVNLVWNPFGQVESISYPAGVTRTLDYDGVGRLKDDKTSKVGLGVIARREHEYNPDGTPSKRAPSRDRLGVMTTPTWPCDGSDVLRWDPGP